MRYRTAIDRQHLAMGAPEPKARCSEEPAAGSGADFEAFHRLGVRAFIATHLGVRADLSSASRMSRRTPSRCRETTRHRSAYRADSHGPFVSRQRPAAQASAVLHRLTRPRELISRQTRREAGTQSQRSRPRRDCSAASFCPQIGLKEGTWRPNRHYDTYSPQSLRQRRRCSLRALRELPRPTRASRSEHARPATSTSSVAATRH
jgi:hypothetical protein